jgi:hypothetical protein
MRFGSSTRNVLKMSRDDADRSAENRNSCCRPARAEADSCNGAPRQNFCSICATYMRGAERPYGTFMSLRLSAPQSGQVRRKFRCLPEHSSKVLCCRKEFSNARHRLSRGRRPLSRSVRAVRARLRSFVRSRHRDPRLCTGCDRFDRPAHLSRLRIDPPRPFLMADSSRMAHP